MAGLKKVRPGDPLRIGAGAYNAFVDAALAEQASRRSLMRGGGPGSPRFGTLWVRNDSGADRDRFDILGLDDPIFSPDENESEFVNNCSLGASSPTLTDHRGNFCVLQEPLADGKIGLGMVYGTTPVHLNVTAAGDLFADVATADAAQLKSGPSGSAHILWKDTGTGSGIWAFVLLGAGSSGAISVGKTESSGIGARSGTTAGSGTVTFYQLVGTTLTSLGRTETAYNIASSSVAGSTYVILGCDAFGTWWVLSEECG